MKQLFYVCLLALILFWSLRREGFISSPTSFLNDIKNKTVCAYFYNRNCGHCTALKPEWDKAEAKLNDKMVAVDLTDTSDAVNEIQKKYNITSYPTIVILTKGIITNTYNGERTESALMNYVKQHIR
jgi:thiol-disulfide isomerase/thioredoxin